MQLKKIIAGLVIGVMVIPVALAESLSSSSFTIDTDSLNGAGSFNTGTSFRLHDTFTGFVTGSVASSSSFSMDSGLVNLELFCGNDIVEFGEQCDDGNQTSGDGCSSTCQTEAPTPPVTPPPTGGGGGGGGGGYGGTPLGFAICGNAKIEYGESCDDGNTISGDGCSNICKTEELKPAAPEPEPDEELITGDGALRTIKIRTRPEKRIGGDTNLSVGSQMIFYNRTLGRKALRITLPFNSIGWSLLESDRLPEGTYDIALKGSSHLTKVMRGVRLDQTTHTLDFTFADTQTLIAGDVHSTKDNFINGLDISATVDELYTNNPNGDLNRDGTVNGLDLSIVISNLYKTGERL